MALTPLQLNAGAGLLQNTGLTANAQFVGAMASYTSTTLISPFLSTLVNGSTGNILSNTTIGTLETLASNTCPALSDSAPYGNITVSTTGFTGLLSTTAAMYLGNGDLTKFTQAYEISLAYNSQASDFISSSNVGQTYLGNTFSTMSDAVTGSISSINPNTKGFGEDLVNLGQLIDLSNLNDLGSPLALVRQIINVVGNLPVVSLVFLAVGIDSDVVANLDDPTVSVSDSDQKLMTIAMSQVVDENLAQILSVLGVKTKGISNMADLLNPYKLFPNSFGTMNTVTADGYVPIYLGNTNTINSSLTTQLPAYTLRSTA
jgi:hypothetical protein